MKSKVNVLRVLKKNAVQCPNCSVYAYMNNKCYSCGFNKYDFDPHVYDQATI